MTDEEKRPDERTVSEAPADERPAAATDRAETPDTNALIDRIQRLQADFENYKKRVARESAEREERVVDRLLLDVLPLYDGLRLAFENYNRDRDAEAFVSGVERIFAQFEEILNSKGVARIDPAGMPFDPALHEALMTLTSDEERNIIVEEFSPGYVRNGRTLRPSRVGVSRGPVPPTEEEE
jgi:molecular chaperone GrpE